MTVSDRASALRVMRELHDEYHREFDGMKAQDIGQNCACHYGRIYRFIRHQPAKRREGQTRDR